MIWNSITTMTVIDLLFVAGLCVCLHVYFRFGRRLYGHRGRLGPLLILLGVGLISLVYAADLAIMHVLPTVMPEADQAAVREGLHLDWSWISTLLGTGFIIVGFILINRNTLAGMARLEELENSLAAELSSRVGEREALRRSEANLVNAQRIARIGSWERNLVDGTGWWSDEAYRLLGYEPRSVPPTIDKYLSQVHPDDREHVWAASGAKKLGTTLYNYDYRIVLPDGSQRYLKAWGETVSDADGRAIISRGTVQDITEQTRAEEELRASEARFRDLIEGSDLGIQIMGEDGIRLFVNQACARLFGYDSTDEIINGPSAMLAAPHERERLRNYRAALFRGEDVLRDYEFDGLRKDGSIIPVRGFNRRLVWEGREAVQRTFIDLTERKRAEEALRTSEVRFRDLVEGSNLAIQITDENANRLFVNQACARLFGYGSTAEIINGPNGSFAAPHERERLREYRAALFTDDVVPRVYEFDGVRKDGTILPLQAFARRLVWEGKEALQRTYIDLTERKRAEAALRTSEARFRDFAEASSDWFWELGPDLRFSWISDRMFDLSGHRRASYIGKTTRELGPPIVAPEKWENYLAELDAHRPVRGFYFTRIGRGGQERHIRLSAKPVFAADGSFEGYRGTGREFITATAAAEQVERIQDQFLNAIENISEGIALFDEDERLVFRNSQYGTIASEGRRHIPPGIKFEDLLRDSIAMGRTVVAEDQVESWIAWRLEHFRKGGYPIELKIAGRDMSIHEQKLPGGGTITVSSDITELKQREEQLRQAQKMEIVGQLTGGVAHDFNNLLAVIGGNLELIGERIDENGPLHELVARALAASNRGKTLTHRLLAFSRKHPLQPRIIDVGALINEMLELLRRTLGETISVETALPDDLWPIDVDPAQLESALLNLAVNARDAMPGGGRLIIEARNRPIRTIDSGHHGALEPGDFVMIAVSDSGTGMSAEVMDKAFDPFFTTKPVGKGSGLGLSMVYGFSKQSGGDVSIRSEPGKSTVVEIYLPRAAGVPVQPERERPGHPAVSGNGECVLVVEDDRNVRELATDLLSSLDYRVLTAAAGPAALKVLETEDGIDLLFTDVVLPEGMDGVELARRARIARPDLRVLYTSGYTEHAFNNQGGSFSGLDLLTKPYRKAELARRIRRTLDRTATAPEPGSGAGPDAGGEMDIRRQGGYG